MITYIQVILKDHKFYIPNLEEEIFEKRNVYDRLLMNNFTDIMGQSALTWLLPIASKMEGEGFFFPKIDANVNLDDLKIPPRSSTIGTVEEIDHEENEMDLEHYFDNSVFKLKGFTLVIKGKQNRVPTDGPDVPDEYRPSRLDTQ